MMSGFIFGLVARWILDSFFFFFFFFSRWHVGTLQCYFGLGKKNAAYSIAVFADYTTFDFFLLYYKYKVSMYNLTH